MEVKTSQNYIEEFFNMENEEDEEDEWNYGPSEVSQFFDGCNIFLTGGSGFIGKLLIDKLLRCTNISKLYMLLRAKKGKTLEERYKEIFNDVVFEKLKREKPNFAERIVLINGETGAADLDLSSEDRQMLRENTHIIFHSAANVRFDEKLRKIIETNVRGTKLLLEFAKEMKQFKAFVHISTAFAHCTRKYIEEVHYEPPVGADKMLSLLDLMNDDALEYVTPKLVGEFPNTYAFSKAVAEDVVQKYSQNLPTCIVRPSICISTYKEPVPGWINNLYGPTGVVIGAGFGLIRSLYCDGNKIADIMPGDYVINNIVVAAWDTAKKWEKEMKKEKPEIPKVENPVIYNCVSACQNPITWQKFMDYNAQYGLEMPSMFILWSYYFKLEKRLWMHNLMIFFLHLVPGAIVDTIARITGREPKLLTAYKKIHKFSGVISYFCTQQWKFSNDRVLELWNKLSPVDKVKYDFLMSNVNWEDYFQTNVRGLRVFLLNDPVETAPAARSRYAKLEMAHNTLVSLIYLIFAYVVYSIVYYLFWNIYSVFEFLWNRY